MKKILLVMVVWFLSVGALSAQTTGIEKSKKVEKDEVPAAVQSSLQDNFSVSPDEGSWFLQYQKNGAGGVVTFKVIAYTFRKKSGKEKVEIRFAPNGNLEQARGIERKASTQNPGS